MEKEVACQNLKSAWAVQFVIIQILIALLVIKKTFNWMTWIQKLNEFTNLIKVLMEMEVACQNLKSAWAVQFVIVQILIALLVIKKTFIWMT